jgi:putative ABC transport system permease protein
LAAAGGRHCAAALGHGLAAARLQPLAAAPLLLTLLALERARRMRGSAAIAVGGVVASLSLAVALTVMVASFRGSVTQWLDAVLPSPLYVRSALSAAGATRPCCPPGFAEAVARLPGCGQACSPCAPAPCNWTPHAPPSRC